MTEEEQGQFDRIAGLYGMVLIPDPVITSRGGTHIDIRCLHVAEGR